MMRLFLSSLMSYTLIEASGIPGGYNVAELQRCDDILNKVLFRDYPSGFPISEGEVLLANKFVVNRCELQIVAGTNFRAKVLNNNNDIPLDVTVFVPLPNSGGSEVLKIEHDQSNDSSIIENNDESTQPAFESSIKGMVKDFLRVKKVVNKELCEKALKYHKTLATLEMDIVECSLKRSHLTIRFNTDNNQQYPYELVIRVSPSTLDMNL
eukprot:GHVH01001599.1.p1 GENE.GHVH01001599.1~~GHVH01001599.1.p1  ORF type:complete len:217 (+),score=27.41 GHVH01001599.1:23-652(+)